MRPAVEPRTGDIRISLGDIGGPSAGLMFALGVVDKLSPGDLTGGRFIAGTGAIDADGDVSPIGGIPFKMRPPTTPGPRCSSSPTSNCAEAAGDAPAGSAAGPRDRPGRRGHAAGGPRRRSATPPLLSTREAPHRSRALRFATRPRPGPRELHTPSVELAQQGVGHVGRSARRDGSPHEKSLRTLERVPWPCGPRWEPRRCTAVPGSCSSPRASSCCCCSAGPALINLYVDWLWFGEVGYRSVFTTDAVHPGPAVPARRGADRRAGRAVPVDRLPVPARSSCRSRAGRPDRPVPHGDHLAAAAVRHRHPGARRRDRGARRAGQLADRAAVPATPRRSGSPTREFGIDVSFYVFELPFYRLVLDWLFVAVAISFIVALVAHYMFGGIRLTGRAGQVSAAARAQLAVLPGVFVLLKAVAYYLDRYELLYSDRATRRSPAPRYTDLNAVMPAKLILLFISIICAAAFFVGGVPAQPAAARDRRRCCCVLSSVLIGAAWPAVLQQFVVAPERERARGPVDPAQHRRHPRGVRADDRTRSATSSLRRARPTASPPAVGERPATRSRTSGCSTRTSSPTRSRSSQQRRNFYGFPEKLDIDRYTVDDGKTQDYIVAARELNSEGLIGQPAATGSTGTSSTPTATASSWRRRTRSTPSCRTPAGRAACPSSPASTPATRRPRPRVCGSREPRIYYGELITGLLDRRRRGGRGPARVRLRHGSSYTYTGTGGVPIGNFFNRLVVRARTTGAEHPASTARSTTTRRSCTSGTRRTGSRRSRRCCTLDTDPYPAVVDGRITWIVDGYTTLANYPYAEQMALGDGHGRLR